MDAGFIVIVLLIAVIGGGIWWWSHVRSRRIEAAMEDFLSRNPRWQRDTSLCGVTAAQLADRTPATPRGDRRFGIEHAATGPLEITVAGSPVACTASCGQWWYEVRRTSTDSKGRTTTTYDRQNLPVVAVELPAPVPADISITPESVFGRIGLTRGGDQLESDAFNRRFRVEGGDRTLTVQLLDARLQQHLLEGYTQRRMALSGRLLVCSGDPQEPDRSLYGPIRDLPGLQRDATDLLSILPPQFWRAIGVDTTAGGGLSSPPPAAAPPPPPAPPMPPPVPPVA